jgi:hypothetical protein
MFGSSMMRVLLPRLFKNIQMRGILKDRSQEARKLEERRGSVKFILVRSSWLLLCLTS